MICSKVQKWLHSTDMFHFGCLFCQASLFTSMAYSKKYHTIVVLLCYLMSHTIYALPDIYLSIVKLETNRTIIISP